MSDNITAAQSGDHLAALKQTRDTLALALDKALAADAGTVAQLAAQYRTTLAEIAALESKVQRGVTADELAARRATKDDTFDASAI